MRVIPFFFLTMLSASASLFAAIPAPGETVNLDHKLAGSAKVYTSEEDREAFADEAAEADAVFTGQIESAVLSRMGFGGAPVPITRLGFKIIEVLKGGPLEGSSFLYRKSPESVRAYHESPAIVLLKKSGPDGKTLFIENFLPADEASLAIVRAALNASPAACGEAEPSCAEAAV